MNTYYLRCRQSRYSTLVARGLRLGVIAEEAGQLVATGCGVWDYIGPKFVDGIPAGGEADPWVHVNLYSPHNLRELAMQAAATDPDIASGLAEIAAYFITDAQGNPVAPEFPLRVLV